MPRAVWLGAIGAAVASGCYYRHSIGAYFWNDDFVWLYLLHDRPILEVLLTPLGGHTLVARNLVFAALDRFAGLDAQPYFATVLLTHAVNVVLLARIIWLLTDSAVIAALGALAWGVCLTASESLTWYSVYAQLAATGCVLLGMGRLAACRANSGALLPGDLLVVGFWLVLGNLFFGTAMIVAITLPAVIVLLFPNILRGPHKGRLRLALVCAAATPAFVHVVLHWIASSVYSVPSIHGDSILWLVHGVRAAGLSFVELLRVGVTSLFAGPWWHPSSETSPLGWVILSSAVILCCGLLSKAKAATRTVCVAFAVPAVALYASVALSRGPMLVGLLHETPAQVAATLRYHYSAQAFMAVTVCVALSTLPIRWRDACAYLAIVTLLVGVSVRPVPAQLLDLHSVTRNRVERALSGVGDAIRAAPPGDTVVLQNHMIPHLGWMPNTTIALPGLAALFVIAFPSNEVAGRIVRFEERNQVVFEAFTARPSRLARVLVRPGGAAIESDRDAVRERLDGPKR
ncbi:MAG: hypothetical protein KIT14_19675 [bacterium]|nr:hypothetical protein [bacterium]